MKPPLFTIYKFDDFQVNADKRLLTKGGKAIPLTPKAFATLLYLVTHRGEVLEKEELMRAIWPDTIVEENNLNQSVSTVRRALGERRDEHRFIVTVPGRGYKFVAEVREENCPDPADAPLAPEFQHAGKIQEDLRTDTYRGKRSGERTLNKPALAGLVAIIIFGLGLISFYSFDRAKPSTPGPIKTIAVLPFTPLVAADRNEGLELGMAESLISKLSSGDQIVVRSLDSVRRLASSDRDTVSIGRELGVEAVLDGSMQISGERIRISARLTSSVDGKQIWTRQFDEKLTDIFTVQDLISERVAEALQTKLRNGAKKNQTESIEAYQLYVKGRFHAARLIQPETVKGISYFQQAIEIDPNYALAYAALAHAYRRLSLTSDMPSNESMPKAKAAATRAVEIDATLSEAYMALGLIAFWYEWNWQDAERHYLRGLQLDPNDADSYGAYAHFLSNMGRHDDALVAARRARELDPVRLGGNALEGQFLFYAGKHDEALDQLYKTIDLDANFWLTHLIISRVYAERGQHTEAIAAASKARDLSKVNSESLALVGYSFARSGQKERALKILEELSNLSATRYVPPYNFALIYNGLGEEEKALDYLEKGFVEKDVRMVFLNIEPKWNNLRQKPRFIDLMESLNFY